jgi:hypothetical protein
MNGRSVFRRAAAGGGRRHPLACLRLRYIAVLLYLAVGAVLLIHIASPPPFLWKNGTMRDLPPTGKARCSTAFAVNTGGQAVGADTECRGNNLAAVLWEHDTAYDLNRLIGRFPVHLAEAFYISNRGEIACLGTLPNGNLRVVLLVPAGLAARQGLSAMPATSQAPAQHRAAARSVPDARDNLTSILGQLAARIHPRLQS